MRVPELLIAAVMAVGLSRPASAGDTARAAELFKRGSDAYAQGDFSTAARSFEASHREIPRAAAIYNAALAWDAAEEGARAADAFAASLEQSDLAAAEGARARKRLGELEKTLGVVQVNAPGASVTVGHLDDAAAPVRVHLRPGVHEVKLRYPGGRSVSQAHRVGAGQTVSVVVGVAPPAPPPPPPSAVPVIEQPAPPPAPSGPPPTRTWGWVALGAGVALAGAAALFGVKTLQTRDEFESSRRTSQSAHDSAVRYRLLTNLSLAGAAASATLSFFLLRREF